MSAQDDVAVLLKAVGEGGTVEERVRALVMKLRGVLTGMKLTIADPNALTALDGGVAVLGENVDAIVRAVVGGKEDSEPQVWHDVEDEDEDFEPDPEKTLPDPKPRAAPHKSKQPVRRKR